MSGGSVIRIRNVPDDVRDALVAAANAKGQSLQEYLLDALVEQAHLARNTELIQDAMTR